MVGSKLVPPPPAVAKSRAAKVRMPPVPRPRNKVADVEIELGESAIMTIPTVAPPAPPRPLAVLDDVDVVLDEPAAAVLEAICKPAPPLAAPLRKPVVTATPVVAPAVVAPAAVAPAAVAPAAVIAPAEKDDWDDAVARAKSTVSAPAPVREPSPARGGRDVSRGMSDRMRAIEAQSTIAPVARNADDVGPLAGDSFASMTRPRFTPARIGLASAAAGAVLMAAVHLLGAGNANANPDVASQAPVQVIHAAAVFNEATDEASNRQDEQAQGYAVIDNERARKLGTLGMRALDEGRSATAKRMFAKALDANPHSRLALAGLGRVALEQRRYSDAVDYLERAVKIEPRKADNRRFLGDAYAGQGRTSRARYQYEKAVQYGDATAAERLATQ